MLSIQNIAEIAGAITVILGATLVVLKGIWRLQKIVEAMYKLAEEELKTNSGSSMKDYIVRVEDKTSRIESKLDFHINWADKLLLKMVRGEPLSDSDREHWENERRNLP